MPRISNPATKKKPGPKGWATEEQWDFLVANCPDFRVAQAARGKKDALDTFWKKILKLFLEQFPIEQESEKVLNFWRTVSFPHLSVAVCRIVPDIFVFSA